MFLVSRLSLTEVVTRSCLYNIKLPFISSRRSVTTGIPRSLVGRTESPYELRPESLPTIVLLWNRGPRVPFQVSRFSVRERLKEEVSSI